jgi:dihydrofolate reductase
MGRRKGNFSMQSCINKVFQKLHFDSFFKNFKPIFINIFQLIKIMIISTIVATAHDLVIGKDNQIPWYLPADLQYFKRITLNHHIIMGRNCYESIGRPLPKRTNIIVTRNPFYIATGCITAHSIEEALRIAEQNGEEETFIIGGGEIYTQSAKFWDRIYWTDVDLEIEKGGNTERVVFFPKIDLNEWALISEEKHAKDDKNDYDFAFKVFEKV